jgi:hypothetical protein
VTIRRYVRRLDVGKNKTGSNAVPFNAWTAVDAPGRIAFGTVFMSGEPKVGSSVIGSISVAFWRRLLPEFARLGALRI